MRLLYCDESNLENRNGDFLIYGGLSVPNERASELSAAISQLRAERGIAPLTSVKFAPPPDPLDHQGHRALKEAMIQAAIGHDCHFIAYAVLHNLATDPDTARRYGINTLCWHFQCALSHAKDDGIVLIDRFNDQGNRVDGHLREKMAEGVAIPHRGQVPLDRIVGFHYSADGQSHFSGLTDIVVGSLRWAMNVHCRGEDQYRDNALNLIGVIAPLFWRRPGTDNVPDIGFCLSPFNVQHPPYRKAYLGVQEFLREGGVNCTQPI